MKLFSAENNIGELSRNKLFLLFERLKKDKKALLITAISFLGIFFIMLSEFVPEEKYESSSESTDTALSERVIEKELESVIGEMSGVGRVRVMITYEGTSESIYAHNLSKQSKDSDIKTEKEHIILDKGNEEEGLLIKEIYPKVAGVAVVCEGGGDYTVKNEINQMLKALFSISSNSISISEMRS